MHGSLAPLGLSGAVPEGLTLEFSRSNRQAAVTPLNPDR